MEQKIKPITLRIEEYRKGLIQLTMESALPPCLIEILLGEYLTGISMVSKKEYQEDLKKWESKKEENHE